MIRKLGGVQFQYLDDYVAVVIWSYLHSFDVTTRLDADGGIVAFTIDAAAFMDHVVLLDRPLDLLAAD